METLRQKYTQGTIEQVKAKLKANGVDVMDKKETDKCLSGCVCAKFCTSCADYIRDNQ
jgi:hypothetical protein